MPYRKSGCKFFSEGAIAFPLTPLIDMTFLLLIFFMVTSQISRVPNAQPLHLPIASVALLPKDVSGRLVIGVDAHDRWFFGQKSVKRKQLPERLRSHLLQLPSPKKAVVLRADASTSARVIKELMEIATDAGATQVIFSTVQK